MGKKKQHKLDAAELKELAGIAEYLNTQANNDALFIGRVEIFGSGEAGHRVRGHFDYDDAFKDHPEYPALDRKFVFVMHPTKRSKGLE